MVSARTFDSTRICDVCTESSRYPLDTSVNNCGALVWKDWGKLRIVLGTSEKKICPTFIKCKEMERDGWGTKWNNEKLSLDMKSVTFEILSHFQTQRSGLCRKKKKKKAKTKNKILGHTKTVSKNELICIITNHGGITWKNSHIQLSISYFIIVAVVIRT
jgi:hypothetical protein